MRSKLAEIIKSLRLEHGESQQVLADILEVSRSAIGNYELGLREPDMETLEHIADHYNVDLDFLYGKTPVRRHWSGSGISEDDQTDGMVPETIAAHFDGGAEFSEKDLADIGEFIEFVKARRRQP